MKGRTATGEPGDRQIKAPPEEVHRTGLAQERRSEAVEHPVHRDEGAMETLHRLPVIGPLASVGGKGYGVRHFVRLAVEGRIAAQRLDQGDEVGVKVGHRRCRQRQLCPPAVAGCADNDVIAQIEQDFDAGAIGNWRRGEPPGCDIEGRMPRVIDPGRMGKPVLPCNLQEKVESRAGFLPAPVIEIWPVRLHRSSLGRCFDA